MAVGSTQGERLRAVEVTLANHIANASEHDAALLAEIKGLKTELGNISTEIKGLVALKNRGLGAALAISIFGALIIAGFIAMIKDIVK